MEGRERKSWEEILEELDDEAENQKQANMLGTIEPEGLYALEDHEWEEVEMAVDSGATETVIGEDILQFLALLEGLACRRGVKYEVANGVRIPNLGEKRFTGITEEGVNFYRIAMIGLGVGSIPLLIALMRGKMISTWLGRFGLLGYSFLIIGILADIIGEADIGLMLMIPGALFELTFAIWLISIGFDSDSIADENKTSSTNQ